MIDEKSRDKDEDMITRERGGGDGRDWRDLKKRDIGIFVIGNPTKRAETERFRALAN
jgi:hypothetical protein